MKHEGVQVAQRGWASREEKGPMGLELQAWFPTIREESGTCVNIFYQKIESKRRVTRYEILGMNQILLSNERSRLA